MRRLVVLLVLEAAATAGVAAVGPALVDEPTRDPTSAAAWLMAVGVSAWLLVSTACCVAIELLPLVPSRLRALVHRLTHPAVRATVAGAIVLAAPVLDLPVTDAASAGAPTTSTTIRSGRDVTVLAPDAADRSPPQETEPTASFVPGEHRVAPGDNLWTIAADRLATHLARVPTEAEVARYWAVVVEVNGPHVRSGDPDLVFPGELVTLPPL